jgi:SagB-type dehydrogenase family enzyme
MNALTKMALGLIGQLKPAPAAGYAESTLVLPAPQTTEGLPLMQALRLRQSQRSFDPAPLPMQTLSNLLWAAAGVNRTDLGGRTAPSAMNAQEVDVYAALPGGLYQYEPVHHRLLMVRDTDVRRVTGYQDFVDTAPLDLVYVAHHGRMSLVPAAQRDAYAWYAAGAMSQNASLYCASAGLATVIRAWIARDALAQAMGLTSDEQVLVSQTVGLPKAAQGT